MAQTLEASKLHHGPPTMKRGGEPVEPNPPTPPKPEKQKRTRGPRAPARYIAQQKTDGPPGSVTWHDIGEAPNANQCRKLIREKKPEGKLRIVRLVAEGQVQTTTKTVTRFA